MSAAEEYLPDAAATIAAGAKLAAGLQSGEVIALIGRLGAGKTHFTQGLAAGLGVREDVTSPTFPLLHEYRTGRIAMFHFDFYRLERESEVLALGWDEYLEEDGVCVVEWADKFPALLPPHTQWWQLRAADEGGRWLERTEVPA